MKEIRMSDVWESMNGEALNSVNGYATMNYGKKYSYNQENSAVK